MSAGGLAVGGGEAGTAFSGSEGAPEDDPASDLIGYLKSPLRPWQVRPTPARLPTALARHPPRCLFQVRGFDALGSPAAQGQAHPCAPRLASLSSVTPPRSGRSP